MSNVYFELTKELNHAGIIAALSSGQAVVWYRLSLMSKDGDWILREDPAACATALDVLARHGARYRPAAPLDVRWLRGGWSSHFEFVDPRHHRVRCDFVSRPPRIPAEAVRALFERSRAPEELPVVDLPSLIATKQTQRAKDYPIIGALAGLLPPELEVRYTTDPDRVLALAVAHGASVDRPAVVAARRGATRTEVVMALAAEIDHMQQRDRGWVQRYQRASEAYLREFQRLDLGSFPLAEAHARALELAGRMLPVTVPAPDAS